MRLSAFIFLLALPTLAVAQEPVPPAPSSISIETFIAPDSFDNIKISPDGLHYAASVPTDGGSLLVVLRASDMKQTAAVSFEREAYISSFEWASSKQVIYSLATKRGSLAAPRENGSLYRVNADGTEMVPIRADMPVSLEDSLRGEDNAILVGHRAITNRVNIASGHKPGLSRLEVSTGRMVEMDVFSPLHSGRFHIDNAGEIRFVSGNLAGESLPRLYRRVGKQWDPTNVEAQSGVAVGVLGFSGDNKTAYLQVEQVEGTDQVVAMDLASGKKTPIQRHERVDPIGGLRSPIDGAMIAVRYFDGKPGLEYVVEDNPLTLQLKKMELAFPGQGIYLTSYTRDGGKGIYFVSSDVNSGEYYLVDHASGKAHFIAAANEALDPRAMSPMRPFRFKARDGLEIEGFLTVPQVWGGDQPGPMVVIPHGGPKGIFDRWGFDREVQMLASRGYAVLQLNFRGSGNYGRAFRDMGDREWGGKMQDDLTDATRWAIAQGVAQEGRICLYGASYGAYAAMMGLVRETNLYACGIGNVGVYDLEKLYREETFASGHSKEYFDQSLGQRDLGAVSPNRLAAAIRVPVLLGAGELDAVAPPEHTDMMKRALEKAGVAVEAVEYEEEGHGNYLAANRLDWAQRVLALLDRTIGNPSVAPIAANQEQ